MTTTQIEGEYAEKTTFRVKAVVEDEAGTALIAADIDAMSLTLCNKSDGAIINGRDGQDILNTNGGLFDDVAKEFFLTLTPADMAILDPNQDIEVHVALIEWTFGGGKAGKHQIEFVVKNLTKV